MTEIDHSIRPDGLALLAEDAIASEPSTPDHGLPGDILGAALDDATVAYVLAARPAFDALRRAAGQLAGLFVLASAGAKSVTPDHPMLATAQSAYDEAGDALGSLRAPDAARHHHHHLRQAAELIGLALDRGSAAIRGRAAISSDMDQALTPLKAGYRHLQWAAGALPGFEIVAFQQGCCASHPAVEGRSIAARHQRTGGQQR